MRTTRTLSALLIVAFAVALVGCSDDNVLNPKQMTVDEQAINDKIATEEEFQHDVVSHAIPDTTGGLAAAATGEYYWWREYTSVDRQVAITITPADTLTEDTSYASAEATITSTYGGQFHIVHRSTEGVYTHTTKAMTDVFTQSARFEQRLPVESANRGWQRTELSNIVGGADPTTLSIDRVDISWGSPGDPQSQTVTAESVDALYPGWSIMSMDEEDAVNMSVQTGTGTNDVYYHDWCLGNSTREQFANIEMGYYAHSLTTPSSLTSAQMRRQHVIDVVAPDVIEGDAAYDALIWAIPYVVVVADIPR